MKSSSSSFESILEALIQQKQVLEDMHAENETLRQQLADLRAGQGIFLEILGTRIPLAGTPDTSVFNAASDGIAPAFNAIEEMLPVHVITPLANQDASLQETSAIQLPEPDPALQETMMVAATGNDLALQPTASISSETLQMAGRGTPLPGSDFVIEDVSENGTPVPVGSSSSFLEDALLAEFTTASTRHMENWSGPITNSPIPNGPITNNPNLDEEEKAALRRELMGSYILE
jgi:hypothetical protein